MYKTVNNRIYITKGDSASLDFHLIDAGGQQAETEEVLIFTVTRDGRTCIEKQITDRILLTAEETAAMETGEYKWRVVHLYNNGADRDTVAFGEVMLLE